MADSMIFYRSFRDAIKKCDKEDALTAYESILDYGLDGIEPKDIGPVPSMIFDLVKPQIDANSRRRENGKKGGRPVQRHKYEEKPMVIENENHRLSDDKTNGVDVGKPNVNVNDNENVNVNDKESHSRSFSPPTIDEVKSYCKERNNNVDAQKFVDFYESKGWMVGKNKMKDWKACVRTWEQRESKTPAPKERNHGFEQRNDYDMSELERLFVKN